VYVLRYIKGTLQLLLFNLNCTHITRARTYTYVRTEINKQKRMCVRNICVYVCGMRVCVCVCPFIAPRAQRGSICISILKNHSDKVEPKREKKSAAILKRPMTEYYDRLFRTMPVIRSKTLER
jgi:hypothetical protein